MHSSCSMDVKLSIGEEEEIGMNASIKEEVQKDEGGASLKEETAGRTAEQQDPAKVYVAARKLAEVIKGANVEDIRSTIGKLAHQTDSSVIFNFRGLSWGSVFHIAAATGNGDILRLLFDQCDAHLIVTQDDFGNTPLHIATKAKAFGVADMLIFRARQLHSGKNVLRIKNKHGNTALHEAVLTHNVDLVSHLLREDLEPVYWMNAYQKSPLYLALDSSNSEILQVLFSLSLDPSRIKGLPPVHGAIVRRNYDLAANILKKNIKLFAMTDSKDRNVFHLAAHTNDTEAFKLLRPETEYLAQERDMDGDLPIHIASKMGYVELIENLQPVSDSRNKQGQTVLHVAAKYGQASAVKYILKHPDMRTLINERDHAGNTALHLAAMHSQPVALIPLVLDERIDSRLLNHECLTALKIAEDRFNKSGMVRTLLAVILLRSLPAESIDLPVLRPKARDKGHSIALGLLHVPKMDDLKDAVNARLVVATLVATVTFAADFAVPGGFNGSDRAFNGQGMATMLDKRMFQAFAICNTIAMLCATIAAMSLMYAQADDIRIVMAGFGYAAKLLTIALPAMSGAFLTGVTLTVGKLPWLANTIFYLGLLFLLIISGASLLQYPQLLQYDCRPLLRLKCWLVLGDLYVIRVKTNLLDDPEEDGTASKTTASPPPDCACQSRIDESVTAECQDSPHPPNH